MGVIVDQNSNPSSVDTWAIVTGNVVANLISANLSFIESIQSSFDYLVDIDVGLQSPVGIGYIYDPGNDTFATPPIDYSAVLRADVTVLQNAYSQLLTDYNASIDAGKQGDANNGIFNGLSDASNSYSPNEQTPFETLVALVQSGG